MANILFSHDVPILDIGTRTGHTDYIDFIKLDEVRYPVMKGTDLYNRPFVVVKFMVIRNGKHELQMETFFQRYTIGDSLIQGCGHATSNLLRTEGGMTNTQIDLVNDVINGKTVTLTADHRPFQPLVENTTVSLYTIIEKLNAYKNTFSSQWIEPIQ